MSKCLKLFETTSEYQTYINGGGVVLPNVSVAEDDLTKVYYNPYVPPFFAKLSLTNGEVVELQGSGELTRAMVSQYSDYLVSAVIGELCTSIGNYAFQDCADITSITIPDSVTSIGDGAFTSCNSLTSITIPNSVTSIDNYAFYDCTGLTSITIPNSVTSIGDWAFKDCTGLTSCTIGSGVTSIGDEAFSGCSVLTDIIVDSANTVYDSRDNCNAIINKSTNELIVGCKNTIIPNTVTGIGDSAFSNRSVLTSIDIPNSVTSIGGYAFNGCEGLTSIDIPSGVTSIGDGAFNGCTSLTNITSNAMTAPTIQSYTFQNVKTGGTLTVPSGSTGYDVWMGTGNYYLGKYGWTKLDQ